MKNPLKVAADVIDLYEKKGWTPTDLFRQGELKDGTIVGCMVGIIAADTDIPDICNREADAAIAEYLGILPKEVHSVAIGFDGGFNRSDYIPRFVSEDYPPNLHAAYMLGRTVGERVREWHDSRTMSTDALTREGVAIEEALQTVA